MSAVWVWQVHSHRGICGGCPIPDTICTACSLLLRSPACRRQPRTRAAPAPTSAHTTAPPQCLCLRASSPLRRCAPQESLCLICQGLLFWQCQNGTSDVHRVSSFIESEELSICTAPGSTQPVVLTVVLYKSTSTAEKAHLPTELQRLILPRMCLQVKPEYAQIEQAQIMESGLEHSFAREHYSTEIEKGINEQINTVWRPCIIVFVPLSKHVALRPFSKHFALRLKQAPPGMELAAVRVLQHYNLMYAYSAMASYFARDNVALLGFAKVNTLCCLVLPNHTLYRLPLARPPRHTLPVVIISSSIIDTDPTSGLSAG